MQNRPDYTKIFTRDFTLATVEIWVRPEVSKQKFWTKELLPYSPYIVVEGIKGRISAFYDPRGIQWLKKMLKTNVQNSPAFLETLVAGYTKGYDRLKNYFGRPAVLSAPDLTDFLSIAEDAWSWFEACWWLWELTPDEKEGVILPDSFFSLRENTQDIVPEIERVVRASLRQLYPQLSDFVEVLSVEEIKNQKFPNADVLRARHDRYFFVDGSVMVGKDRPYIENKYNLTFESPVITDQGMVSGQCAFRGKVSGPAKLIYGPKDIQKVEEGDVIISPMTMPDVLPAMKRSIAFVTDEGGIMSHAAIISREMKKPCVIGTKFATEIFKDGDLVEVDADRGVVKILNL